MKQSIQPYIKKLQKLLGFTSKHVPILLFMFFAALAGFLVVRIGSLAQAEPTSDQIAEATLTAKNAKLDETAISQLNSLQDHNISIEALFDNGRTNPFED